VDNYCPSATQHLLWKISHCVARDCDYVAVMDWQQIVSLVIVSSAALALAWSRFRRRKFSFARDSHCSCPATSSSSPQSSIVFRARKGERTKIVMKMK
jgi:hypothetical protein